MGGAIGASRQQQETASKLYKQAHARELVPGRSVEAIASAALYISLRIHDNPRSLDETANVPRIPKKKIQSAYRYLCRELDIALKPIDPEQYVERIVNNIPIPNSETALKTDQKNDYQIDPKQDFETILSQIPHNNDNKKIGAIDKKEIVKQHLATEAKEILSHVARTHHTSGHDPTVLAATAVYAASIASGIPLTQNSVKQAGDVTEVSIRKNYTKLLVKSPHIPLIENDIKEDDTPKDISQKLNDKITYLNSKISQ